jgi:predicted dehydrogenase
LRVAVVGAGVMGRYHALNYATLPRVELVAMVDPDPARCLEMRNAYGCRTYGSVEELLVNETIDAASVAVPTILHYPVARTLLEANVHVLVEKPVATDVEQARIVTELSRTRDLVLQVGHITRFYEAVKMLSSHVDEPYLIEARRLVPSDRVRDVGVVLDLMIHDIDIVLGLVHGKPVEVSAAGHVLNGGPHEDVAAAQILFDNGCVARFLASRVSPDSERSLLIAERNQTIRVDFAKEPYTEVFIYRAPKAGATLGHVKLDRHVVHEENPLRRELEHFVARIRKDAAPIGTLDDDVRSLALATTLLAKIDTATPTLARAATG